MKYLPHIIAGLCITAYLVRTVRKALEDPEEEERCYSSSVAAIMDGAADVDDEWLLEPEDWQ